MFSIHCNSLLKRLYSSRPAVVTAQETAKVVYSAATTASSGFRRIFYNNNNTNTTTTPSTSSNLASTPPAFLLKDTDYKSALDPISQTIDTTPFIEPTLKHLTSLSLQSKPQINQFNALQARAFFAKSPNDTGSVEVQCGQLTAHIMWLGEHCSSHKHDYKAQRKIVELVAIRRKFLRYLRKISLERFYKLLDQLSLPPNYIESSELSHSKLGKNQNQTKSKIKTKTNPKASLSKRN